MPYVYHYFKCFDTIMDMISKLWRTLCTSMGLVSHNVDSSPKLVMMKKNSFVGKLIIFDSWSLPV